MCNFKQCQWTDIPTPVPPPFPMPLVNYQYRKIGSCHWVIKAFNKGGLLILEF